MTTPSSLNEPSEAIAGHTVGDDGTTMRGTTKDHCRHQGNQTIPIECSTIRTHQTTTIHILAVVVVVVVVVVVAM